MTAVIQKWGNSHALRLPKSVIQQTGLSAGAPVQIETHGQTIMIRPDRRIRRIPLKELLRGMTRTRNRYPELATRAVGREVI